MRILVTNDDGYLADGIETLAGAARGLGTVELVAPETAAWAAAVEAIREALD